MPRMGPTRRLQPPGVALSEARAPNAQKRRSGREACGAATSGGCRRLGSRRTRRTSGGFNANAGGGRVMSGNCNPRRLRLARSKRTPVTCGCSAPPGDGSSSRNRQRLRPARRPPAAKRSQSRCRQPAQTPTALRLRRHDAPRPRSDPRSTAANQLRCRQSAPPSVHNAPGPRSDLKSTAANQPRRRQRLSRRLADAGQETPAKPRAGRRGPLGYPHPDRCAR